MAEQRFNRSFTIDGKPVGDGAPVYVIAEAGISHFGDENKAYQLVDMAVEAGADAVKFQVYDVEELMTKDMTEWRDRLGPRQLDYDAFKRLQNYCKTKDITFFATAHDEKSLAFLAEIDVPLYKIGSGEVGNWAFLQKVASLGKPLIFSVGMYDFDDIQAAIDAVAETGNKDLAVLHCVTKYPTEPELVNLGNMKVITDNFNVITGYSDHTRGYHVPLAAVAMGAQVIEKHITIDYDIPNAQDWKVSCGPDNLSLFMSELREIEKALGSNDFAAKNVERGSVEWATKSLVAASELAKGYKLCASDLLAKRPGNGIKPSQIEDVIGKVLARDVGADEQISWDMFNE